MASGARILVVDDEAPVREVLSEYLLGQGYVVDTAAGGREALAAVRRQRPDLVLLDLRMEDLDGLETLRELVRVAAGLPVVMVTANEDVTIARETLRTGAFDYVAKPFDFAYLERTVTAALLHGGAEPSVPAPSDESFAALTLAAFRAARTIPGPARASTGERLETAALAVARHRSAQALDELALLVHVALTLGDLAAPAGKVLQESIAAARDAIARRA